MKNMLSGARAWVLGFLAFLFALSAPATADTILKFPLSDGGFDMTFDGTVLSTVNDGNATTLGDQNTNVVFSGVLNFIPEINTANASFTLANVLAFGLANVIGPVVAQQTTGGNFSLWDASNNLLISGSLNTGVITGTMTDTTGSFFNTTFASFTGGSLASLLDPASAGLSLALASIMSQGALPGLRVGPNGELTPFTADGSGLLEGAAAVPEPMTLSLLLVAMGGAAAVRRRDA